MKKIKISISILLISFAFLSSCSVFEDDLEQVNPNEITTDTFFVDLNSTNLALNTAYATLLDQNNYLINQEACRADLGWPGFGRPEPRGRGPVDWYFKTFNNATAEIKDKWESLYQGIFRANQVIFYVNKLKDQFPNSEDEITQQLAQARFLRGLFHFYLHTSYNNGRIIIRDELISTPEDFNKRVSSSEEVKAFFREDLIYAFNNLPTNYSDNEIGRATRGAAAAILGTSYLYDENHIEAISYFDEIINGGEYQLVTGEDVPLLMFTNAGEFNSESIFEIVYSNTLRTDLVTDAIGGIDKLQNRLSQLSANISGANVPMWLAHTYKTEPMDPLDPRNFLDVNGDTMPEIRNVPLRASQMVGLIEDEYNLYYMTDFYGQNGRLTYVGNGISQYKKYTNHDIYSNRNENDNPNGGGRAHSGKNVTLIRLAEILLMKAECLIKTNDIDEALDLINQIRDRWGLVLLGPSGGDTANTYDEVTYTEASLMNHLMFIEKPLELAYEGNAIRWTDLRRWGVAKQRFDDLANRVYFVEAYTFTRFTGATRTKNDSSVVLTTDDAGAETVDFEYDLTAQNYLPELHDYLPIPLSEINSNTELNN